MALQIQKDSQAKTSEGNNTNDPPKAVTRQALIDGLNHDLAGEYQAIVMYTHYSAKLTGPYRRELRTVPSRDSGRTRPRPVFGRQDRQLGRPAGNQARVVPQAEEPREMLENALAAEKQAISDYEERIRQAEALGEVGLKVNLETQVSDETRHKEEIERILVGWR